MRVRCPLVLGVVVAALGALLLAPPAGAHSPGLVLRGFGTPTVDGLLGPGEWSGAATRDLVVSQPGGGTAQATVLVMNDRSKGSACPARHPRR